MENNNENSTSFTSFTRSSDIPKDFVPKDGQLIYVSDMDIYKMGDGITNYYRLPIIELDNNMNNDEPIKRKFGCLKAPKDSRDYQLSKLLVTVDKTEYPTEYIPIYEVPFFDQGDSSMCCACATAMSRYIYELTDSGNNNVLSPMYIYGNRCKSSILGEVYTGEGMYLKDALKQLINMGDCYYDLLPGFGTYKYCKCQYECVNAVDNVLDDNARPFRVSSYWACKTNKQIKRAVLECSSVLTALTVTEGWYYVGDDGIINNTGDILGGHAVLIVGWKVIEDKEYWIILNSWGASWGDHGFGYLSTDEDIMEAYCIVDDVHELDLIKEKQKFEDSIE